MLVELEKLKANPLRDFAIDPIDLSMVERLQHSIEDHGFWGGVVCRHRADGSIEIAAGHHRVQAAIQAGMTHADLFVSDEVDDLDMVLIYSTENATQRGNTTTALAGSVASALRFLTKMYLTGTSSKFGRGSRAEATIKGQIEAGGGVGRDEIFALLHGRPKKRASSDEPPREDLPGIKRSEIDHQLANLKTSGHYQRIVEEVKKEIAAEQAAALAQAEATRVESERLRQEQEAQAALKREAAEAQRAARERRREAEEERKAAQQRAREASVAAERARREADAKEALAKRQEQEALAALAEKRRKEAEEKEREFAALRATAETKRKEAEAIKVRKQAALDSAEKAAKASAQPRTFDFEGVQRYFHNEHQVDVFRKIVTSPDMLKIHPVERQVELAKFIVDTAKDRGAELTGRFIREQIRDLLMMGKADARQETKAEQQHLLENDLRYREREYQSDLLRALGAVAIAGRKLETLYTEAWPKGLEKQLQPNLIDALTSGRVMLERALAVL